MLSSQCLRSLYSCSNDTCDHILFPGILSLITQYDQVIFMLWYRLFQLKCQYRYWLFTLYWWTAVSCLLYVWAQLMERCSGRSVIFLFFNFVPLFYADSDYPYCIMILPISYRKKKRPWISTSRWHTYIN